MRGPAWLRVSLARDYASSREEIGIASSTLGGMLLEVWHLVGDPSLSVDAWMPDADSSGTR